MADDELLDQSEIEKLLAQAESQGGGEGGADSGAASAGDGDSVSQSEIEAMLSGAGASPPPPPGQAVDGDSGQALNQGDIESLLGQAGGGSGAQSAQTNQPPRRQRPPIPENPMPGEGEVPKRDVEFLLDQAEEALQSLASDAGELPENVVTFQFPEFGGAQPNTETATFDLVSDVELDLKIELGRTEMFLEDVLKLRQGSVIPLDKLAGDPVDVYVNGRLVARGEVLVLNDNFCVRVAELVAGTMSNGKAG